MVHLFLVPESVNVMFLRNLCKQKLTRQIQQNKYKSYQLEVKVESLLKIRHVFVYFSPGLSSDIFHFIDKQHDESIMTNTL
jgi:hypothetical protein